MRVWILGESVDNFIKKFCEEITDFILFWFFVGVDEDKFITVEGSSFRLLDS